MLNLISPLAMRFVESKDQTFLDVLYRDSRADLLEMPLPPAVLQQMIAMQQMSQAMGIRATYPNAQTWLVLWDGEAVGRLVLETGESAIRLIDIAVMSNWRGKGIATQVIRGLQDYAALADRSISLAVQCSNLCARHLYQGAGFILRSSDTLFDQMDWCPAYTSSSLQ
ncbi:MAG: GNAT family N-acetyltransferase [Candidatus Aquirickettsiella gammari]